MLVCRTLSKSFSLAGLRVGYAVGHVELIQALDKIKDSYNLNLLSQVASLAALKDIEWMRRNVKSVVATRERLATCLSGLGYDVTPSQANFLWVRPQGIKAAELYQLLGEAKIVVRYVPGEKTGDYIRITIGTDEEIDQLINVISKESNYDN